jgi:hypothetical protein
MIDNPYKMYTPPKEQKTDSRKNTLDWLPIIYFILVGVSASFFVLSIMDYSRGLNEDSEQKAWVAVCAFVLMSLAKTLYKINLK